MKFRKLRVAVLTSKRAPGLEELLHHPQRDGIFEIACLVSTEPALVGGEAIERAGVPVLHHPIRRFCEHREVSIRNFDARRAYDRLTATTLRLLKVDTVLLLGYLYVLTDPMLSQFPDRIVNVHDSDLSIRRLDGERCYVGLHSTRDAIVSGERVTRSTVHFVTSKLDAGPVILMSDQYPVPPAATAAALMGDLQEVRQHAFVQRHTMMKDWGTLAARALAQVARGSCDEGVADGSDALALFDEPAMVPA